MLSSGMTLLVYTSVSTHQCNAPLPLPFYVHSDVPKKNPQLQEEKTAILLKRCSLSAGYHLIALEVAQWDSAMLALCSQSVLSCVNPFLFR